VIDRSTDRAGRKQRRLRLALLGLASALAVVFVVTMASVVVTTAPSAGADEGVTPSPTATPRVTATPSPTVAPTPMPTPTPQPAEPWTFQGAWLEVPCVGISGPITEYTTAMLVDGAVEPAAMDTISWYSGIPGGILSREATRPSYVYGHSWIEPAAFNGVRLMTPGCEAIITTGNGETLTYRMAQPTFSVSKPELSTDLRVREEVAGRLVLISCYRPDGYDPNAATVENVVALLELVPLEPVREAPVDPQDERRLADRLW